MRLLQTQWLMVWISLLAQKFLSLFPIFRLCDIRNRMALIYWTPGLSQGKVVQDLDCRHLFETDIWGHVIPLISGVHIISKMVPIISKFVASITALNGSVTSLNPATGTFIEDTSLQISDKGGEGYKIPIGDINEGKVLLVGGSPDITEIASICGIRLRALWLTNQTWTKITKVNASPW